MNDDLGAAMAGKDIFSITDNQSDEEESGRKRDAKGKVCLCLRKRRLICTG